MTNPTTPYISSYASSAYSAKKSALDASILSIESQFILAGAYGGGRMYLYIGEEILTAEKALFADIYGAVRYYQSQYDINIAEVSAIFETYVTKFKGLATSKSGTSAASYILKLSQEYETQVSNLIALTTPWVSITSNKLTVVTGETINLSFRLSEPSTSFDLNDISISTGSISGFSGSGQFYSATFTPPIGFKGNVSIGVSNSQFTDLVGNPNLDDAFNRISISIDTTQAPADTTPPTISYSTNKSTLGVGETATITFTLSETSTNFTSSDVSVSGGSLTNFSGSGTRYSATFTPTQSSTTNGVISVNSGVFTDASGNANPTSMTLTITVNTVVADTTAPTIAVSTSASGLTSGGSATITFALSEASSNFTSSDVTVSGGTLSNFSGSGTSYTATFTPAANSTTNGVVSVANGVFTDAAGNANADGSDANNSVTMSVNTTSTSPLIGSTFVATKNADAFLGTTAIDTIAVSGGASDYSITKTANGYKITDKAGLEASDTVANVERVKFTDSYLALDIDGNAGTTAKILGAVFGKDSVGNKAFVGIGLSFLDAGWTYDRLGGLALDAAGAQTNDQIVTLLWTNVIGSKPSIADKAPFIALLENGMTPGELVHLAADTIFNTNNINLVGLSQTGIEFNPV
jgi:hypothetical protein